MSGGNNSQQGGIRVNLNNSEEAEPFKGMAERGTTPNQAIERGQFTKEEWEEHSENVRGGNTGGGSGGRYGYTSLTANGADGLELDGKQPEPENLKDTQILNQNLGRDF